MKHLSLILGLWCLSICGLVAAETQVPWTDVNVPVSGRRLVYRGIIYLRDAGDQPSPVDYTLEYANVQPTADGVRYDLIEKITLSSPGTLVYDTTETRELRGDIEVILRRVDRSSSPYFRSETLRDATYTQGNIAPRVYEIGAGATYEHRITGLAALVESRSVFTEKFEDIDTAAGKFATLKVGSSGLVLGNSAFHTVWLAKGVGPVRIFRNLGVSKVDVLLVSANFPLNVPGFDQFRPKITVQPESLAVASGTTAQFRVTATGDGITYAWSKDGAAIPGATTNTLTLTAVSASHNGMYRVKVISTQETVESETASLLVTTRGSGTGKFLNMSVRSYAQDDSSQLIAGMVMQGASTPHRVLIRAVGPRLGPLLVSDYCRDPSLVVRDSRGAVVEQNDNWGQFADQTTLRTLMSSMGGVPFEPGSADAALVTRLGSGSFTGLVRDQAGGTALLELFDTETDLAGGFSNLSVRSEVRTNPVIVGLVVGGTAPVRVLVRAVGPSLARFGVPGVFANPNLNVVSYERSRTVANNDDWGAGTQKEELRAAFASIGAFELTENSADAALVAVLPQGIYTVGVDPRFGTGNVLIEVYVLP